MMFLTLAIGIVLLGCLLVVDGYKPAPSSLSVYELCRRKDAGDKTALASLRREELKAEAASLKKPLTGLLLVALTLMAVGNFGWFIGAAIVVVIALFYARAANSSFLYKVIRRIYHASEQSLLDVIDKRRWLVSALTNTVPIGHHTAHFGSREELLHRIEHAGSILSIDDKKLLTSAIAMTQRRIADVMTKRKDIINIEHTEMLGPLVLSDLHSSGHSCFPVVVNNVDSIIGMLDIRALLALKTKRTVTAAKAITSPAYFIRDDQTIDKALGEFVYTRQHLLVVRDHHGTTVGLVSLRDVIEAFLGRKLSDGLAIDDESLLDNKAPIAINP